MFSERFTVRRLQTAEEVGDILCARSAALGFKPGALDHFSYFAADPTGFFVGELDGKVISSVSAVKYSDDYAFLGHYNVDKPYRGKGYGLAVCRTAMASLPKTCNFGGDVVEDRLQMYEKRLGYKRAWRHLRASVRSLQAALILSRTPNLTSIIISPASDTQFGDLLAYDTSVHVYTRLAFLRKWIFAPNCYSYIATCDKSSVLGYAVVRTTLRPEDGWKIGPLFADNAKIARRLYKAIFDTVSGLDPSGIVTIDVPFGGLTNPDAVRIMNTLMARVEGASTRMYSKRIPSSLPLHKVFGVTSLELG